MLSRGSYFSGQKQDEKILHFVRRHWLSIFPWLLVTGILIILQIILVIVFWDSVIEFISSNNYYFRSTIVFVACYLLFILSFLLTIWINYYLDVTIITTKHLVNIRHMGLLNRQVAEQSLLRVQDVSSRMHGFLETLFSYGTVYVETAGEAPNFQMVNIPRPYKIANTIMKQHEICRREELKEYELEEDDILINEEQNIQNKIDQKKIEDDKQYTKNLEKIIQDQSMQKVKTDVKNFKKNNEDINSDSFIDLASVNQKKDKKNNNEGELKEGIEIKL